MALITTKAIVFSAIKYGDSNLIVKCFTKEEGLKSYMIYGVLKSKKGKLKMAYFQPLTQLKITANHKQNKELHSIKEVRVINHNQTIYASIVKQSLVLFLSEVLSNIIKEEEQNQALYNYIETSLIYLDSSKSVSNFHLLFLINLSHFLGFYPDVTNPNLPFFSLSEGNFTSLSPRKWFICGKEILAFKKLFGKTFETISEVSFSKNERKMVLDIIIKYFELHLEGFKKPKSLEVFKKVFV